VSKIRPLSIEIFCAPDCNRCGRAVALVQELIQELDQEILQNKPHISASELIQLRKINVIEEIDYAVSLGVRATPAIVIDGKLSFTSTPNKQVLKNEITSYW